MRDVERSGPHALLFDIGNVVVRIDFERVLRAWAGSAGVDVDRLRDRFAFDTHYERHERGEIDAQVYFDSLRRALEIDLTHDQFLQGWNAVFVEEVEGISALLERARGRLPLYAFSNTNAAHRREWATRFAPVLAPFERVFVSCELGRRKPEPESFHVVARAMGVACERVLFFDDAEENVAGARATGMQAVLVRTADDVRRALASVLA